MSASCSQRLLSLWLRRLPTDRIARSREVSAPLVVYGKRGNAELLTAVNDAAERRGLSPGITLAQARAMHPSIEALEEEVEADAALLESIADWCLRYTPLVAVDAPDGLLLDISGCAHLYGGEEPLVADLSRRLENAASDSEVIVRSISTEKDGAWLAVVNTGLTSKKSVRIRAPMASAQDCVSGVPVPVQEATLLLDLYPCQLRSFKIVASR